jgi:class 3 adenylate cyclase/tetratricopeptide (TPR) repeat protein
MPACPACGARTAEGARFCQSCGRPLVHAAPSRDVRKTVTVLFADITGSTALAERLDAESVRALLGRYFTEVRAVLERHGGSVEKFIGDAVMAVFGVPVLHEDDAMRAVRAAQDMRSALSALNERSRRSHGVELRVRTGINTGEVVVGDLVGGQAFVTGDAVNVAARLEQLAPPGQILLGEATYRLVRDAVTAEAAEPLEVRGREERVRAYRLTAVLDEPPGARRVLHAPMVGRAEHIETLRAAFEATVAEESCQVATVLGPAGVGKSRLVGEFLSGLGDRATSLAGRCLSYGEGITFWPVAEIVRAACGLGPEARPGDVRAGIAARVAGEDHAERIVEGVAQLIGVAGAAGAPEETPWGFRRFMEAVARERPLVIMIDDVHWAEPRLLDLVEYLADFAVGPLLIVCMGRHELLESRPAWGTGGTGSLTISLDQLSEPETGQLIGHLLGLPDPEPRLLRHVSQASEGNPLFVEEMLRMFIDEGALRREEDGPWSPTDDLYSLPVPPSISTLLAARLERVSREERLVAQRAAVVGKVFYWGAVTALSPEADRPAVGAHLRGLVRKELITPEPSPFGSEDAFRFQHILVQDAAYRSIPKEERAELHERFATWMLERLGDRVPEYEEILGHHLEQAYRCRAEIGLEDDRARALAQRAAERLASSGRRALGRRDVPGAVNLLSRAADLVPSTDPARAALLVEVGEALMHTGRLREAETTLAEALEASEAFADRGVQAHARLAGLLLELYTDPEGKTGAIRAEVERVIPVFRDLADERGLAQASQLLAEVEWMACRYRAVQDHLERTIEHAARAGDRAMEIEALARLAGAHVVGPTPAELGIRRCREVFERSGGDRRVEAAVLSAEGQLRAMLGRFEGTREQIARARDILEDLGLAFMATGPSEALAFVEMLHDDPAAAERELRWGYRELERMGERGFLSTAAAELAQATYAQGRLDDAERYARISEGAAASDDLASLVPARSVLARVMATRGQTSEAEDLARRAVEQAELTDNLNLQGDALMDLAEVLRLAGRAADAADALAEAAGLYEEKGNVVSARKAQAARDGIKDERASRP